ncbi:MAG: hypothetical protein VKK32_01910 [Candidatus Melainabacteria bacterium]|nr:hypothetical protein [Candidatus Melainabacteria bacterium]
MALIVNTLPPEQSINSSLGSVEPEIQPNAEKKIEDVSPSSSKLLLKKLAEDNENAGMGVQQQGEEVAVSENQFFKTIQKIFKPAIDGLNKGYRPVIISSIGAALHFLDSFVESSNLPPAIKNLSYKSSIWYSKTVTVLPNALAGINSLVKNDFMDGVSRIYSLVAKLFQSKPANFSVSSGFFPGVQMAKLAIGKDKYDAQNFKSFGENINFFLRELKNSIGDSFSKLKKGDDPIENILKIIVPTGLISSTLVGSSIIGDEVSTAKAKSIGFVRNLSGVGGDLWLMYKAYKEAIEEHGAEKALAEVMKSNDFKVGFPYILASIGELLNRYVPPPVQDSLAQLFCGANETISAFWGMISKEPVSKTVTRP